MVKPYAIQIKAKKLEQNSSLFVPDPTSGYLPPPRDHLANVAERVL
jgi:hypothetical protein